MQSDHREVGGGEERLEREGTLAQPERRPKRRLRGRRIDGPHVGVRQRRGGLGSETRDLGVGRRVRIGGNPRGSHPRVPGIAEDVVREIGRPEQKRDAQHGTREQQKSEPRPRYG